jgi:hypothetical protein
MSRSHLLAFIGAIAGIVICPRDTLAIDVPIGFGRGVLTNGVSLLADQSASLSIDVAGTLHSEGSGVVTKKMLPFVFTSPLEHQLENYLGPVAWNTNPAASPYPALDSTLGLLPGQLVSVQGLSLELSDVENVYLALLGSQTTNSTNPDLKNLSFDVFTSLSEIRFSQTGAALLGGSNGFGTFAVPGMLSATLKHVEFNQEFLPWLVGDQFLSVPLTLSGNWSVTGSAASSQVVLDTSGNTAIPWSAAWTTSLDTFVVPPAVGYLKLSSTHDLEASLLNSFSLHLTQSNISLGDSSSHVNSGAQVAVDLLGGASATGGLSATFDAITSPGTFAVETMALQPGADPSILGVPAFTFGTPDRVLQVWQIDFSGEFTGQTLLTFNYVDKSLPVGSDPSKLAVMHFANGQWQQLPTVHLDTANHLITVATDSFSPFALAVVPEPSSLLLSLCAAAGVSAVRFRRRRRK